MPSRSRAATNSRHCERSEAIHSAASRKMDCFVASAPRNDAKTHLRDLAACIFCARYSFISRPPNRGRRECRAPDAPDSRVCNGSGRAHTRCQVTPESPGIPHAMVYGLFRALPGAPGFLATVTREKLASQELDTSVGVPGPHVFTVRLRCLRQKHHPRPPHPAPRFVTLRNAPLSGRDGCEHRGDLGLRKNRIFFRKGLDTGVAKRPDGQISCVSNYNRKPRAWPGMTTRFGRAAAILERGLRSAA